MGENHIAGVGGSYMQLSNQARRHIAVNAAISSTQVLIYQALHDRYGFSRGRFAKIDTAVDEYSRNINHDGDRYSTYRDKIDAAGLDLRLKQDFIRSTCIYAHCHPQDYPCCECNPHTMDRWAGLKMFGVEFGPDGPREVRR